MALSPELEKIRHSAAHLLAHAVKELFPKTILTIGPATEEGFFYDMLPEHNFKEEDLPLIEERMYEIAKRNLPLEHYQVSKEEARKIYKDNRFKLELIDQIPGDTVGIAQQGDFLDLCKGGHVKSTGDIKYFKLLNISGAYWRADRAGQALQRISGTAFLTQKDLDAYLQAREDAIRYDHRRLGKELDLFSFHEEGPGFPFYHPHGKIILNLLTEHLRKFLRKYEYQEISTPVMLSVELWKQSGHYSYYKEHMYFCHSDDRTYALKPMNCPGTMLVYKERPHSYRELPMRLAEFGLVHRYELSGAMQGLFRAREFTQDDAHLFITPEQIEQEVYNTIQMVFDVMKKFNFGVIKVALSTKPEKAMGGPEIWELATQALKNALEKAKVNYTINEGDGAFYGPKIDFHIEDSMGRTWQCGTIQLDFVQPENFDLMYVAADGTRKRPVMIHRAIYGSFERFLAILIEHYKGKFPFWLAPVQIKILTITDAQKEYARNLLAKLKSHNLRVTMDESSDPIAGQIKTAQLQYIPWMLVIGKKEVENNTIALRYMDGKQEFGLTTEQLLEKASKEQ